ncbi:hypothetical protein [Flavobacterium beibuense]|uniref:hypothetical protein n=1 Tax=Flavobacterium beibuense TaxID=657326 RepID=UPI00101D779D|nr:hypothetical protein [Flavobacterium beibuense]
MDTTVIAGFIEKTQSDGRLRACHVAIMTAIFILAFRQDRVTGIKVSRRSIMRLSHIGSIATYHKYFKDLQELGYFSYVPSYHPGLRSVLNLNL